MNNNNNNTCTIDDIDGYRWDFESFHKYDEQTIDDNVFLVDLL